MLPLSTCKANLTPYPVRGREAVAAPRRQKEEKETVVSWHIWEWLPWLCSGHSGSFPLPELSSLLSSFQAQLTRHFVCVACVSSPRQSPLFSRQKPLPPFLCLQGSTWHSHARVSVAALRKFTDKERGRDSVPTPGGRCTGEHTVNTQPVLLLTVSVY